LVTNRFVLAISGSPSATSKSSRLADHVLGLLAGPGIETRHIPARSLDPAALMAGDMRSPALADLAAEVERANGLVLTTPIFKASYSGLLKAALDFLPQYALAGKVVLPLATGGSPAHVLALDYALRPVLQSMGARHIVQSHFVADAQITPDPFGLDAVAQAPLLSAMQNFRHSLTDDEDARWLGHPKPPSPEGAGTAARPTA
jgi:FMN reductase